MVCYKCKNVYIDYVVMICEKFGMFYLLEFLIYILMFYFNKKKEM